MSLNPQQELLEAHEAWAEAIFRHLFFRLSDRERALELVQEVFLRVWQTLVRGERVENMRAFLYRIAHNLIIDEYRKTKSSSLEALNEETGFEPVGGDENDLVAELERVEIIAQLHQVPTPYREALVYRYVDDLPVKEIATLLGETENVISVRIHRGLGKLRQLILQHGNA